jgi:hypothetical protein
MDKEHYETALLLTAGAVLGQVISIALAMSWSIWSFVPMSFLVILLGGLSLRSIALQKSLVKTRARTRVITGVWMYIVWELFRLRVVWLIDGAKFSLLFIVLFVLYSIVQKTWEADHA